MKVAGLYFLMLDFIFFFLPILRIFSIILSVSSYPFRKRNPSHTTYPPGSIIMIWGIRFFLFNPSAQNSCQYNNPISNVYFFS